MPSEPPFLAIADLFARVSPRRDAIVHGQERWSFGRPDPDLGATIHAVIEIHAAGFTVEALGAFLLTHLARSKHPRSIELRADPVRDDAGKFRKPRPEANR